MTLMFTQSQRDGGKANLCSYSVIKFYEATQMFPIVDYVREMIVKKSCKYGNWGSYEHFLFLYLWCLCVWGFLFVYVCFVSLLFFCLFNCFGGWGLIY